MFREKSEIRKNSAKYLAERTAAEIAQQNGEAAPRSRILAISEMRPKFGRIAVTGRRKRPISGILRNPEIGQNLASQKAAFGAYRDSYSPTRGSAVLYDIAWAPLCADPRAPDYKNPGERALVAPNRARAASRKRAYTISYSPPGPPVGL